MAREGTSPQTDTVVGESHQQEQTANPATSVQEMSRGSSSPAPMPGLSVPGPMMDPMTTVDRRAPLVGRDELLADLVTFSAVDDPAGSRVNFVHPKDAGGVLVELVEPAGHH